MQQKVQFIVTIIHEPPLLIFDEPFTGFDPINANLIKHEILNLRKNGATIIFSTHNMASVEELCDNIALINNSHKILEGSVKEIKKRYKTNTYSIDFDGYSGPVQSLLPAGFILAEDKTEDELRQVIVTLPTTATQNELLNAFMPYVNIHAFREIIPTMNEIFIKTVHAAGSHSMNS